MPFWLIQNRCYCCWFLFSAIAFVIEGKKVEQLVHKQPKSIETSRRFNRKYVWQKQKCAKPLNACIEWSFPVCCMFMVTQCTQMVCAVNAHETVKLNAEIKLAMRKLINEKVDGNSRRKNMFKWCTRYKLSTVYFISFHWNESLAFILDTMHNAQCTSWWNVKCEENVWRTKTAILSCRFGL